MVPRAQAPWPSLTTAAAANTMPQPHLAIASPGSHIQPSGCTSTSASTAHKTRPAGPQACSGRPRAWYLAHRHPGRASPPPQQLTPCLSLTSPSPPSVATSSPQAVPPPPALPLTKQGLLVLRLVQGAHAHGTSRTGSLGKPHHRRSSPRHASASPRHRLPR